MTVVCLIVFVPFEAWTQSGKAFLKEGDALRKEQQLEKALEKYTLAVQVEPGLVKAWQARAETYRALGLAVECAHDLRTVAGLLPKDASLAVEAAKASLDIKEYPEARQLCEQALASDPKRMDAWQVKVRVCLAMEDIDCATAAADKALAMKATTDTYYLHGLARMAARDYKTAEFDLEKVIEWNYLYEDAYVALAETQLALYRQYSGPTMQMRTLDKAVEKCSRALELNPQSTAALFTRSKAFAYQKDYSKAIDDVSRCMALGREDAEVFLQRAGYYQGFGQYQNAINDLNRVLLAQPKDLVAIQMRADCREANLDLEGATRDLDALLKAAEGVDSFTADDRKRVAAQRERIAKQLFEMNREEDPPLITVVEPFRAGDVVQVSSALANVRVSGHVRDRNLVKQVQVNGMPADFARDEKDPEFRATVPLGASATEIRVEAVDVYDNLAQVVLRVERTEGIPPALVLTAPQPGGEGDITVGASKEDLFIEGHASDASRIRSITVDGVFASFIPDTTATDFSIKLPIKGKEKVTVRAEDQFGNATEHSYRITRKADSPVVQAAPTPAGGGQASGSGGAAPASSTGITWVVYIENSQYAAFPALQNTATDMAKMQKTFAKYNVQRTITKKNMSRAQLERFFSIELRDLVRTNKVSTILVWYTGHGRTVSGKTYWVPVDGKKDDIYSYYNYGPLKSLLENYSESVTRTLVVSDAAGSDPSFYELTR
ncbi:MAG: caspase family protein [Flavobacteriales bacterium]|nr:caspase family protein [Flavobacteriales bacterium]